MESNNKPYRIAFGHQARVGKDSACNYLSSKFQNSIIIRFASPVYNIAEQIQMQLNKSLEKNPRLLQLIGLGLREVYGDDIWSSQVESQIQSLTTQNIFIPDLRFKNEADMLKKHGFLLVKIIRKNREIDRDPRHKSEIDLEDYPFDLVIENDGTINEFYNKLDKL